jgi:hypothetical protein
MENQKKSIRKEIRERSDYMLARKAKVRDVHSQRP